VAEKMIRVCDVDGAPATHTVKISDGRSNYLKDLCDVHFAELIKGTRKPRRGRQPGSKVATRKSVTRRGVRARKVAKPG
jgi:hypothetical protein